MLLLGSCAVILVLCRARRRRVQAVNSAAALNAGQLRELLSTGEMVVSYLNGGMTLVALTAWLQARTRASLHPQAPGKVKSVNALLPGVPEKL